MEEERGGEGGVEMHHRFTSFGGCLFGVLTSMSSGVLPYLTK